MSLHSISPIDGRYESKTKELQKYFSEYALIRYRLFIEIKYLEALQKSPAKDKKVTNEVISFLYDLLSSFDEKEAQKVKEIEKTTNHDIKAIEYYLKDALKNNQFLEISEWVHFGLTSQDINNTAIPCMIKDAFKSTLLPTINDLVAIIQKSAFDWKNTPLLARTHGQPASPTFLGKEIMVFIERIENQIKQLIKIPFQGKFGGAVGNLNAHYVTFPDYDWHLFCSNFLAGELDLERQQITTQIEHYDMLAAHFHALARICTILIDLCRDIWTYISFDIFLQKKIEKEVGSSAMPHKVNPIDFENAEGNLGLAIALFDHLANKLPISRLQRDLTDSTVLRNVGMPYAHMIIALKSIQKGWQKLVVNHEKIKQELDHHVLVLAEAYQTILRREKFDGAYEALKEFTRGNTHITQEILHEFIHSLPIDSKIKAELLLLRPETYTGRANF